MIDFYRSLIQFDEFAPRKKVCDPFQHIKTETLGVEASTVPEKAAHFLESLSDQGLVA
jgi:hypothetical protein